VIGIGEHAKLSASASNRWIHCTPSARLCERYPDSSSAYALEGTQAHELAEYKLKSMLGLPCKSPVPQLSMYSAEMDDYVSGYCDYVLEIIEGLKQSGAVPLVLLEQRVDFGDYVPYGFGTADVLIITDDELRLIDLKYGKGVQVSASENSQLMLYALGAMSQFGFLYGFSKVILTIYQPRLENVSTYETSVSELVRWANEVLRPAAALADAGEGEFAVGDWCTFCRAKNECRARADHNLELARYAFRQPPLLEDWEITDILSRVDELTRWANGIKDYAFREALAGKRWPGWKLCEGRSVRKYSNEKAVEKAARAAGYYTNIFRTVLIPLSEMEKKMGKRNFNRILGNLVIRPPGKPVLVPESDKRPEMSVETAAEAFVNAESIQDEC